jgi:DNA-directed RNA polymerase specialized sigma24 family protein
MIIMYGRKADLSRDQIRELIDMVFDMVRTKKLVTGYDSTKGRFRDYLGGIIRNQIMMLRRRALAKKRNLVVATETLPEPAELYSEDGEWNYLWQKYLLSLALDELKSKVSAKHFQIFQLCQLQGKDADFVAKFFQESKSNIYAISSRCTKTLKDLVSELREDLPMDGISEEELLQRCYSSAKELRSTEKGI